MDVRDTNKMASDSDEEYKRKRKELDESFGRSKKKRGDAEPTMIKMMQELMSKSDDMMEELRQLRKENVENNKQLLEIKQENQLMKKEITSLNGKVEQLEKITKKRNLIITGIRMDKSDDKLLKREMENFLAKELQFDAEIRSAQKIGDNVCLIETESMSDKIDILKNKSKLRNLQEKIFIEPDLTKKEQNIQKIIRGKAKEERDRGNQAKVGYKKLIVNGIVWKWNEDAEKLQKVSDHYSKN